MDRSIEMESDRELLARPCLALAEAYPSVMGWQAVAEAPQERPDLDEALIVARSVRSMTDRPVCQVPSSVVPGRRWRLASCVLLVRGSVCGGEPCQQWAISILLGAAGAEARWLV